MSNVTKTDHSDQFRDAIARVVADRIRLQYKTVYRFSQVSGVNMSTLNGLLKHGKSPSAYLLSQIEAGFGKPAGWLMRVASEEVTYATK